MRPRRRSYSWLWVTLRWTALGLFLWPVLGVAVATAFFGMDAVVIDGESMYPALRRGDVVLVDPTPGDLAPGQVIMFDVGNGRTTHRLVQLTDDGWITAGDANRQADSDVIASEDIDGRGVLVVPYVGWVRTQPSTIAALFAIGFAGITGLSFTTFRLRSATALVAVVVIGVVVAAPRSQATFAAMTATTASSVTTTLLSTPTDVVATPGCGLIILGPFVDVSWQVLAVGDIEFFDVQRGDSAVGPFTTVASVPSTATSHRDQTVSGLTQYWYRVVAGAGAWTSEPSGIDDASTGLCV